MSRTSGLLAAASVDMMAGIPRTDGSDSNSKELGLLRGCPTKRTRSPCLKPTDAAAPAAPPLFSRTARRASATAAATAGREPGGNPVGGGNPAIAMFAAAIWLAVIRGTLAAY